MITSKESDHRPDPKPAGTKCPGQSIGSSVKLVVGEGPELVDEPNGLLIPPGSEPSRTSDGPELAQNKERPQRLIRPSDGRQPSTSEHVKPTNSSGYLPKRPQHVADLLVPTCP